MRFGRVLILCSIAACGSDDTADAGATAPDASTLDAATLDASPSHPATHPGADSGAGLSECGVTVEAALLEPLAPDEDSFRDILTSGPGEAPSGLFFCPEGNAVFRLRAQSCNRLPVNPVSHCDGFGPDFAEVCGSLDPDESPTDGCRGPECYVEAGCESDDDCAASELCVCASAERTGADGYRAIQPLSACVPATCHTDAECGELRCMGTFGSCGGHLIRFDCQGPGDECRGDTDCQDATEGAGRCVFDPARGRFMCDAYALCE